MKTKIKLPDENFILISYNKAGVFTIEGNAQEGEARIRIEELLGKMNAFKHIRALNWITQHQEEL